jgi:hypothetical protein
VTWEYCLFPMCVFGAEEDFICLIFSSALLISKKNLKFFQFYNSKVLYDTREKFVSLGRFHSVCI